MEWVHPAFGCYDAGWCSWVDFFQEVGGLDLARAQPLIDLSKHVGFFLPFDGACIVSAPHTAIRLDDNGDLHCEDGPAITYLDGFSVYAINGHRIPADVIEDPKSITLERIRTEENAETRRVMIDRFPGGPGKWLAEVGAEVVDTDSVPTDALDKQAPHLMRALMRAGEETFLVGTDGSTRRTYFMPVEGHVKTCREAHETIMPFGLSDGALINQS